MPPDFPHEVAGYACPLINPPAQRHLFRNKIHNLQLAIGRMQGFVLLPGEEFSFWRMALEPVAENGYREGAMFINHRVTTSMGGGLCQLSGLIYNLALLSGCEITERFNHSIDAYGENRYIPLGRDATVAYDRKNLRFRNPYAFALRLHLAVNEQLASGSVRAEQSLPHAISIEAELMEELPSPLERVPDSSLLPGEEKIEKGLSGKIVQAWRVTTGSGEIRKELLSRDQYHATPTLLRHHTGS
ncbi:MAG TPA: VanW family protein [Candidatus Limnocylindrales bacterium]|nr:VanW family protein [Candidatus Limnocylindrales bacterium]